MEGRIGSASQKIFHAYEPRGSFYTISSYGPAIGYRVDRTVLGVHDGGVGTKWQGDGLDVCFDTAESGHSRLRFVDQLRMGRLGEVERVTLAVARG
jgi:hypothetical protein